MKALIVFVFVCLFFAAEIFAQNQQSVENDLYKSFNKIGYWKRYGREHSDSISAANDSLEKANDFFSHQLMRYTAIYPFTLTMHFDKFDHTSLITSSDDGMFRIYSWDTEEGGTMHFFENVLQYKSGAGVSSILKKDTDENNRAYVYEYNKVYTLKNDSKTWYLATFDGRFSTKDIVRGIRVFSIENGVLNDSVKLIETASGLQNKLAYEFNIFSVTDKIKDEDIHYNSKTKTISIPLVLAHGRVTNGRVLYKFTGQYFERMRN